jgi:crotonobetainyl-CoA:carnitine CoA-transferase CaiB-like acyl-CoA transferase
VTVLALEQMQVLPFATQMLGRLGADVIKVEPPKGGESGRASLPAITRENGEKIGATFLRNNLNKKSVTIDVTTDEGRHLIHELAKKVDIVCENLGPGRAARQGVDYETLSALNPRLIYLSISGFGNLDPSPYAKWPAYACVAEAMSGMYEYARLPHQPPIPNPLGGIGDSGTGLYALVGVLAALRHRDQMGEGQYVDISMYDSMLSLLDLSYNYFSLGLVRNPDEPRRMPLILDSFQANDGWVVMQIARRHQFDRLANLLGHPEWIDDESFAGTGWIDQFLPVVRPALEAWSMTMPMIEAARILAEAGLAAAPCYAGSQVADDEHVKMRNMVIEIPRTDGVQQPVYVAGNPLKMTKMVDGADKDFPYLGEHTEEVLSDLLGLSSAEIARLQASEVIGSPTKP